MLMEMKMNFRQLPHLPYVKIFILVFSCFGAESEFLEKKTHVPVTQRYFW